MRRLKWIMSNLPEVISCTMFGVVLLDVFLNVLLRYFFAISFTWCEEVAAIGFIWIIFIGAAACYKRKMHIGIDVLLSLLPKSLQIGANAAVCAILLVFNGWLTYLSLRFSLGAWTKLTLALGIPYTFLDVAATVGFVFMTGYAALDLVRVLPPAPKSRRA